MTPKEWFGLIIRTLGLIIFFGGLYFCISAMFVIATPHLPHKYPPAVYAGYGLVLIALSLYFLRGAPALIRFSYPEVALPDGTLNGESQAQAVESSTS